MPRKPRVSTDISLSPGDCELCREMIKLLRDLEVTLDRCERAGIDVSRQRQARNELLELYEKFAAEFLPGYADQGS